MILSFSLSNFEELIKQGVKIFTLREDKHNRGRAGMKIHFWKNSPRNPSKIHIPLAKALAAVWSTVFYLRGIIL